MSNVRAVIYGKEYSLACDDGQEKHLENLVNIVNERVGRLGGHLGHLPEPMMLLYSALMLADELHESKTELARAKQHFKQATGLHSSASPNTELENTMASTLNDIAGRIESIAAKLV
jgi:cell division protein ZapA